MDSRILSIIAFLFLAAFSVDPALPGMQILVLQWPPTLCKIFTCTDQIQQNPPNQFTIHGVWPANTNGKTISCNESQPFGPLSDQLIQKLNRIWPNYVSGMTNMAFWCHEWKRHGSCSGIFFSDYFENAADKGTTYCPDILTALRAQGITPNDTQPYPLLRFQSVIQNHLHFRPIVRCKMQGRDYHILEVGLCLNGNFEVLIDCPVRRSFSGCGKEPTVAIFSAT